MRACLWCDLHLPLDANALQYDVWRWAIENVREKRADCILYAGDVTCDGNEDTYDSFIETMTALEIPFLYVPGNSDLRCAQSKRSIAKKASVCASRIKGVSIFGVNDCDGEISEAQLAELDGADANSIVFMHHPLENHKKEAVERLLAWRSTHPDAMLFYGHLHCFAQNDRLVSLPAMDPDKAMGTAPCITYYDTDTQGMEREFYSISVPTEAEEYFGISCYRPIEQIRFATERHLKYLELRPNCCAVDREELSKAIGQWREAGGENLSIHLPEIGWQEGAMTVHEDYTRLIELVKRFKAERVTQHVPQVSLTDVKRDPWILETICAYLAELWNGISHDIVIGVENMHMTAKDGVGDDRRFGYIPEECIRFMQMLAQKCRHKVGINFDVGHARNNAPYSQKYQISTWFSMLGKYIVGYHLHQVVKSGGKFENHMPITNVYGPLISYASFFQCWSSGRINRAPIIFEMRPQNAYRETLGAFQREIEVSRQKT